MFHVGLRCSDYAAPIRPTQQSNPDLASIHNLYQLVVFVLIPALTDHQFELRPMTSGESKMERRAAAFAADVSVRRPVSRR